MPAVKLESSLLGTALWVDKPARDLYLTALLMAVPYEVTGDTNALMLDSSQQAGFIVWAGRYGIVRASGPAMVVSSGVPPDVALGALNRLCSPEIDHVNIYDGRRMTRIEGGYLILDYEDFRAGDKSAAQRQKEWRERQKKSEVIKQPKPPKKVSVKSVQDIDDFAMFWESYPRKTAKANALKSWLKLKPDAALLDKIISAVETQKQSRQWTDRDGQFIPHAATWLNQRRWEDSIHGAPKTSDDIASSWKTVPVVAPVAAVNTMPEVWPEDPVQEESSPEETDLPFTPPDEDEAY